MVALRGDVKTNVICYVDDISILAVCLLVTEVARPFMHAVLSVPGRFGLKPFQPLPFRPNFR